MSNFSSFSVIAEQGQSAQLAHAEFDPLAVYDTQTVGKEFTPYIPPGEERRITEIRRDQQILKTWRGVPTEKRDLDCIALRNGLTNMRDFETQRVIDSERMFVLVLGAMTVLMGVIFAYFVMNFRF